MVLRTNLRILTLSLLNMHYDEAKVITNGCHFRSHIKIQAPDLNRCIEILLRNPQPIRAHRIKPTCPDLLTFNCSDKNIFSLTSNKLCVNLGSLKAQGNISPFGFKIYHPSSSLADHFQALKSQTFFNDGKTAFCLGNVNLATFMSLGVLFQPGETVCNIKGFLLAVAFTAVLQQTQGIHRILHKCISSQKNVSIIVYFKYIKW